MVIIGVDVGGTFTDVAAVDEGSGSVRITKVPSTPRDEARAVLKGLQELVVEAGSVRRIVHGTTVGTNAILQGRGARVALLTTAGFRDLIEIGRTKRNLPSLFQPTFVRPKPVVSRPLRFEVQERILYDGTVLQAIDERELGCVWEMIRRAAPEALAVCFLHSYANSVHERHIGRLIREVFPGMPVSLSSEVVPEYREFERFSTTVINAFLQPVMDRYLEALDRDLKTSGYPAGALTVGSSGGMLTVETARRFPVKTVFSGPVGGVTQAVFVGRRAGLRDLITYDMGGTSTDVCLVQNLLPLLTTDTLIRGFPVKTPQVDVKSVGAGGGSVAWVDVDGSLQVGPRSAGSDPGPACYGLGGREPAVTDANLLLGRISTSRPLGGMIRLDAGRAREALATVARGLPGLDPYRLAGGVIQIAVARMASLIREVTIERGHDPRSFTLVAFGGAGPMHAIPAAKELSIPQILVPLFPGNFSALGLLASDIKHDYARTRIRELSDFEVGTFGEVFRSMRADAVAQLEEEGFQPSDMRFDYSLDLRYLGQAFELNIPADPLNMNCGEIGRIFHSRHRERFGHGEEGGRVETVNFRLTARGMVVKAEPAAYQSNTKSIAEAQIEMRRVYFHDDFISCPVYERERLPVGAVFEGPAVIEEFGATTVLFPHWQARVDEYGNVLMRDLEWVDRR